MLRTYRPSVVFRRLVLGAATVLVSGALVSCTGIVAERDAGHPTPRADASPTSVRDGSDLTRPSSLVPGGCRDFVPDSAAVEVAGAAVELEETTPISPKARQAGVLRCSWIVPALVSDLGYPGTVLTLEVRRHQAVYEADPSGRWSFTGSGADVGADRSSIGCTDPANAAGDCHIDAAVGDYGVRVQVLTPHGESALPREAPLRSAVRAIVDRLRREPVPAEPAAREGDWPGVIDCAALAHQAGSSAPWKDTTGVDYGAEATYSDAVGRLGGYSACLTDVALASTVSGAGWSLTSIDKGYESIHIDGADVSEIACRGNVCSVSVRVGTNRLDLSLPGALPDDVGLPSRDAMIAEARRVVSALHAAYPSS